MHCLDFEISFGDPVCKILSHPFVLATDMPWQFYTLHDDMAVLSGLVC